MGSEAIEDVVARRIAEGGVPVKPRLRFDKVAICFLNIVRERLSGAVPDGKTVTFTIAAPIRVASKTAAEFESKIRTHFTRGGSKRNMRYAIHGNDIRVRVADGLKGAPKAIGFVYTPELGAAKTLLDLAESLLAQQERM